MVCYFCPKSHRMVCYDTMILGGLFWLHVENMPPAGTGFHSWARRWFQCDGSERVRCRFVSDDDVPCTHTSSPRYVHVLANHLTKIHKLSSTSPVPQGKNQRTIEELWLDQCPPLSETEKWLVLSARKGIAAVVFNDKLFRDVTGVSISRNNYPNMIRDLGDKLVDAALRHTKTCSIALDVGTVHKRFLAFVLVSRGRVVL